MKKYLLRLRLFFCFFDAQPGFQVVVLDNNNTLPTPYGRYSRKFVCRKCKQVCICTRG